MQSGDDDSTDKGGSGEGGSERAARHAEAMRVQAEARRERAAKALRENLMRRKQQGRARRAGGADETEGLPAAKKDESQD